MPEFKEKPKMGQPKSKRTAMLDPRHRAKLLKEILYYSIPQKVRFFVECCSRKLPTFAEHITMGFQ